MGTWISKNGVMVPAKEKVGLVNNTGKTITVDGKQVAPGEPYVYEGPDRSATEYLKEQGVESLGRNFWEDPELIGRVRQIHNCSIKEYMEMMGYNEKTTVDEFNKKLSEVVLHKDPPRKSGNKFNSGGRNTAGNSGHYEGDFGDLADAKAKVK